LYRNLIIDRSMSCRNLIIDGSMTCRDLVMTTSLYCRDQLIDTIFNTLRDIPVRYRDGEFVVNEREIGAETSALSVAPGDDAKKIYILLTKHTNITALLLRLFTWNKYTHSSIALERDGAHYSFNPVRGFTIERPIHKKRGETPCRLYCVEVDDRTYAEIESRIKWFVDNPDAYKFNYVGLVFSILRIPVGIGNRYFCSQFVSDLITKTEAAELRKKPSRYFPRHFPKEDSFTLSFDGEAAAFTEDAPDPVLLQNNHHDS
jgi:inositol transport system substrate-binding protein